VEAEFSSAIRSDGKWGAVFEGDDDAPYFYLLNMAAATGRQIVASLRIPHRATGEPDADVRWSNDGNSVAVFRASEVIGIFEISPVVAGRLPRSGDEKLFSRTS
jgi:hypothetical protein